VGGLCWPQWGGERTTWSRSNRRRGLFSAQGHFVVTGLTLTNGNRWSGVLVTSRTNPEGHSLNLRPEFGQRFFAIPGLVCFFAEHGFCLQKTLSGWDVLNFAWSLLGHLRSWRKHFSNPAGSTSHTVPECRREAVEDEPKVLSLSHLRFWRRSIPRLWSLNTATQEKQRRSLRRTRGAFLGKFAFRYERLLKRPNRRRVPHHLGLQRQVQRRRVQQIRLTFESSAHLSA
jgi:hypothetical protein